MKKRNKRRRSRPTHQRRPAPPYALPHAAEESRSTTAATVFWMLATMICLASQVVCLVAVAVERAYQLTVMETVFAVAMMVAAITGISALIAAVVVFRLSRVLPPSTIMWPAIAIAIVPVAYVLLRI